MFDPGLDNTVWGGIIGDDGMEHIQVGDLGIGKAFSELNITSNCISLSFMRTNMTRNTDERIIQDMESKSPLKRLLQPAEVAAAVQYLVDAPPHINGSNLVMNSASDVV